MTTAQILHALKIVDDVHRIQRAPPDGTVVLNTSFKYVAPFSYRWQGRAPLNGSAIKSRSDKPPTGTTCS